MTYIYSYMLVIHFMQKAYGNRKILWGQPHIRPSNKQQFCCYFSFPFLQNSACLKPLFLYPRDKVGNPGLEDFVTPISFRRARTDLGSVTWDHAFCKFKEHTDDCCSHAGYDPKLIKVKKITVAGLNGFWIRPDSRHHLKYFWFCKGSTYRFHCCTTNFI